jgi:hypothetical protein
MEPDCAIDFVWKLACGGAASSLTAYAAPGNVVFTWDSSVVSIYTAPTGGAALEQFIKPFSGFNGTNLYVEGIAPGSNTLSWAYSGQPDCVDPIKTTVFKIDWVTPAGDPVASPVDSGNGQNEFTYDNANPGVLNVYLKASILPSGTASQIADRCVFAVSDIATSIKSWASFSPNGTPSSSNDFLVAQAIFSGLPVNNSAFGSKTASVTFDAVMMKTNPYEVFFIKQSTNHPSGQASSPNWYYYWSQTSANGANSTMLYTNYNRSFYDYFSGRTIYIAGQDNISALKVCHNAQNEAPKQVFQTFQNF